MNDGDLADMDTMSSATAPPQLPADPLLRRVAELEAALGAVTAEQDAARACVRDARAVLAGAFQVGQPRLDCARLRELAQRTFTILRREP